jgi:hypothetical protein
MFPNKLHSLYTFEALVSERLLRRRTGKRHSSGKATKAGGGIMVASTHEALVPESRRRESRRPRRLLGTLTDP